MKILLILLLLFTLLLPAIQEDLNEVEKLELRIEQSQDINEKLELMVTLAKQIFYADSVKSIQLLDDAIEISKENNIAKWHSRALRSKGKFFSIKGRERGRSFCQEALDIARSNNLLHEEILALEGLGLSTYLEGDKEKSLEYFYEAQNLSIYHKISDKELLMQVYGNVFLPLHDLGKNELALEFILKRLKIVRELKKPGLINLLCNAAEISNNLNKTEKAIEYAEEAMQLAEKKGNNFFKSRTFFLIGTSHMLNWKTSQSGKDLNRADFFFQRSYDVYKKQEMKTDRYFSEILMAFAHSSNLKKRFSKAKGLLLECIELASELGIKLMIINSHRELAITYKSIDMSKAVFHLEKAYDISKKLYKENLSQKSSELMVRFDTAKKESDLREINLVNESLKKDAEISQSNFLLATSGAIIFLLVLIVVYIFYLQKKKTAAIFEELSKFDPLTKLMNRRAVNEHINDELNRFNRSGKVFTIVISDIDHFKKFNDTYGHDCGDEVLKLVSSTFKSSIRAQDKLARWGGEEFLLLLPESNLESGIHVAEKIRLVIEKIRLSWKGEDLQVTMSFGVCQFASEMSVEKCIGKSDEALYRAKEAGRNRVEAATI